MDSVLTKADEDLYIVEIKNCAIERQLNDKVIDRSAIQDLLLEYTEVSGFQYVKLPELPAPAPPPEPEPVEEPQPEADHEHELQLIKEGMAHALEMRDDEKLRMYHELNNLVDM